MWATNANHEYNLTFPSSHTEKSKKDIGEINFNVFSLTQCYDITIKIVSDIF